MLWKDKLELDYLGNKNRYTSQFRLLNKQYVYIRKRSKIDSYMDKTDKNYVDHTQIDELHNMCNEPEIVKWIQTDVPELKLLMLLCSSFIKNVS
jgi:hypothetical protein